MSNTAAHAADPPSPPGELAAQAARYLTNEYGIPDDPAAAACVAIDVPLVRRLAHDTLLRRYLRTAADTHPVMTAFVGRLRRVLFFGEWTDDDREYPPLDLMVSLAHHFRRSGYRPPAGEEEASWVKLLQRELATAHWKVPTLDRQVQLLRLALYKPLAGLPFETSLLLVRATDWHDDIRPLIDETLRPRPPRA